MGTIRRTVALALGLVLATAGIAAIAPLAMASGGNAFVSGNTITFNGTGERDVISSGGNYEPYCEGYAHCVFFFANEGGTITPGVGCKSDAPYQVHCTTPGPAEVHVNLGGGNDVYAADPNYPGLGTYSNLTVDGGEGNDQLRGGGAPETLLGGNGDDEIYPDRSNATSVGPDTLLGGAGLDILNYYTTPEQSTGMRLSLNGLADDGTALPRDIDNVGSDFEAVILTDGPDVVVGDARSTNFFLRGGDDVADGGAGNDALLGQAGNDTLDGGPGVDRIWGDSDTDPNLSGNDTIVSTDGESDQITCGPGTDAFTADSIDKILDTCESITTPGGGTPLAAEVAVTKTRLNANKRRKKAPLALQCTGGLPCAGTVVVRTTKGKSRRIAGNKTVALGTFTVDANGTRSVQLKLTRAARKILKRTKRADVRARLTLTNERVTTFTTLKLTR